MGLIVVIPIFYMIKFFEDGSGLSAIPTSISSYLIYGTQQAEALDIDRDYGLIVRYGDGREETVRSGEVSVRGLYGYIE